MAIRSGRFHLKLDNQQLSEGIPLELITLAFYLPK